MIKKFSVKLLLLSSPVIILFFLFLYFDPFKIIYDYDDYTPKEDYFVNRDYVSSRVFIKNNSIYKYNSFMFGSSRTVAYNLNHWKQYLDSGASVFSFDAFGESIFGIYSKIKFLDQNNIDIKNCLIVFCEDVTFQFSSDHPGHIYMKDHMVAITSYLNFYFEHFKAFIHKDFFLDFFKEKIFANKGYIKNDVKYDRFTNQMKNEKLEKIIKKEYVSYPEVKSILTSKNNYYKMSIHKINSKQILMLKEINSILKKHRTKFKIIISPLYNQVKINNIDLDIINNIFQKNVVFDFSGKNIITENKLNYYEYYGNPTLKMSRNKSSHYVSSVGDKLMQVIYFNK